MQGPCPTILQKKKKKELMKRIKWFLFYQQAQGEIESQQLSSSDQAGVQAQAFPLHPQVHGHHSVSCCPPYLFVIWSGVYKEFKCRETLL